MGLGRRLGARLHSHGDTYSPALSIRTAESASKAWFQLEWTGSPCEVSAANLHPSNLRFFILNIFEALRICGDGNKRRTQHFSNNCSATQKEIIRGGKEILSRTNRAPAVHNTISVVHGKDENYEKYSTSIGVNDRNHFKTLIYTEGHPLKDDFPKFLRTTKTESLINWPGLWTTAAHDLAGVLSIKRNSHIQTTPFILMTNTFTVHTRKHTIARRTCGWENVLMILHEFSTKRFHKKK